MKNFFKTTFVAAFAFVMISCGGASKENFVGEWTPDLGSVDIHLSDAIPSQFADQVDLGDIKSNMKKEQDKADDVVMAFKEDGTFTVGPKGDTKDFKWDIDGDNLVISGKVPEEADGDMGGKDFSIALEIVDSSSDEFTLKLSGASILDQAKEQYPKEVEEAMGEAGPMLGMLDLDKILGDTWASLTFKKKKSA